ncbi:hypothetical protein ACSSV9_13910 [Melioribacter sp. OK-6-Me]
MNKPIKYHNLYNKAEIARRLKIDRAFVSRVMRGKQYNKALLERIRKIINDAAKLS